jgi:hypothetical protein
MKPAPAGKPNLDKQTRITEIIVAVAKQFQAEDILKPDGSNLRQWERMLCCGTTLVRIELERDCMLKGCLP